MKNDNLTAVLYDIENIREISDLEKIIKIINEDVLKGEQPHFNTAYTDWGNSRLNDKKRMLIANGTIPHQVISYGGNIQKNASDIALSVDATSLLLDTDFKRFVIVTGDGGFISLFSKLRQYKMEVIVVSVSEHFSNSIRPFVNKVYTVSSHSDNITIEPEDANTKFENTSICVKDSDSDSEEEEHNTPFFKALWAISKSYNSVDKAIKVLFTNFNFINKTKEDGVRLSMLEEVFMQNTRISKNAKIEDIRNNIIEKINGKSLFELIKKEDEFLIINKKSTNNFEEYERFNCFKDNAFCFVYPLTPEELKIKLRGTIVKSLLDNKIYLSSSDITSEILLHIEKNHKRIDAKDIKKQTELIASELNRSTKFVNSVLQLLIKYKTIVVSQYSTFNLIRKLTSEYYNQDAEIRRTLSLVDAVTYISEELFHINIKTLNKKATLAKKYDV